MIDLLQFRSLTSNYRRRYLPLWSFHLLLLKFRFRKPLLWSHTCAKMKKMPNEWNTFFSTTLTAERVLTSPSSCHLLHSFPWIDRRCRWHPNGTTDVDTLLPVFTFASGIAWMLQFIVTPNTNAINAQHNFVSILKIVLFPFSFRIA